MPTKDERHRSEPGAVEAGDLWRNPGGTPGSGSQTAEDIRRPRDKEADLDVVPGFTGTGSSGSQSGRALHGVAPDDLPSEAVGEKEEVEK